MGKPGASSGAQVLADNAGQLKHGHLRLAEHRQQLGVGAQLVDIEFMQFIPISFVYPPSARGYTLIEPAHYGMRHFDPKAEPAHLLNTKGERFVLKHDPVRREGSTRDILARAIMLEILEGRGTPEGGVLMHPDPQVFDAFLKERPIYIKRLLENYGEGHARLQEPIQVTPSAASTRKMITSAKMKVVMKPLDSCMNWRDWPA